MSITSSKLAAAAAQTNAGGSRPEAVAAHCLLDQAGKMLINGKTATTAAAGVAALISASDLTVAGTLTTLTTNVGTNTTEGSALATALVARFSVANVLAIAAIGNIVTGSTPTTGQTVTAGATKVNETLYIVPAGTLDALTVAFPSNTNSQIGQILTVFSTQIVTALTVSAAGLTIAGTALTALAANTAYRFQKVAASTWIRLQ